MVGKPQTLTKGQKREVTRLLWKQILAALLVLCTLFGAIVGLSASEIYNRLEQKLEMLVTEQFEEPRIQNVVSNVAETKAEALLIEQIYPEVEKFKLEINSQLEEIRNIVASIEGLKAKSNSNAEQISKILSSVRNSQQEIEKFQKAILGLHSDLIKLERGIVEIQYFTYKGRGKFPSPYHEQIMKKLNELLAIAVPNPQERAKFIKDLEAYESPK